MFSVDRLQLDKKKSSKGGVLPNDSLVFIFSVILFVTFLLLMIGNMQASAPINNPINTNDYIQASGNINETTNPVGLATLTSNFTPLHWFFVAIVVIIAIIIGVTLLPSWL